MAGTVTSSLTRITSADAGTLISIGGGTGPSINNDIFIQGTGSFARRQSSATDAGFWYDNATNVDLSAVSIHASFWVWHTHYAVLTKLAMRVGTSTTNYDEHTIPLTEYPSSGGWVRVWFDISRTPTVTGGTGLNEAQARYYGLVASLPTVGGTSQNIVLDAVDHTTTGLIVTAGTVPSPAVVADFVIADESNITNKYGVITTLSGINYVRARLTIGSATATIFNDTGEVIVFPEQSLVASDFMGLTIDLANAATDVAIASFVINSAGITNLGDLVVTGTSGIALIEGSTLSAMRIITLTSGVDLVETTVQRSGLLTQSGANISSCGIVQSTGAVGVLSNDPSKIQNCSFTSDGTGHAIEMSTAGTYTFTGNTFSGYAVTDGSTGNEAIYNNSGGLVTLNVTGGGGTPTIRNGAGASTVVNNNISVTLTGLRDNTEIRVFSAGTVTALTGIEDAVDGTADNRSFTFALSAGTSVDIQIISIGYENIRLTSFVVPVTDSSVPIQQRFDRSYANP